MFQAAEDGGAITYTSTGPVGEAAGNVGLTQMFSRRTAEGWSSQGIAPSQGQGNLITYLWQSEYELFSSDLSLGLVEPFSAADTLAPANPLAPGAIERTLYLRNDSAGAYEPLLTPANTPPGTKLNGEA